MKVSKALVVAFAGALLLAFTAPLNAAPRGPAPAAAWHGHPGGWHGHPGWGWHGHPWWGWHGGWWGPRVTVGFGYPYWGWGYPYWYPPPYYGYGYYAPPPNYYSSNERVYDGHVVSHRDAKDVSSSSD